MDWDMFIKASILVLYIVGMLLVAFFTRKRSKTVGQISVCLASQSRRNITALHAHRSSALVVEYDKRRNNRMTV